MSRLKTLYDFCFLLYVYVGSDIKFLKFIYCSNDFSPPGKAHYDSPLAPRYQLRPTPGSLTLHGGLGWKSTVEAFSPESPLLGS